LNAHLNRLPRTRQNLEHRLRWLLLSGATFALTDRDAEATRAFRKANLIAGHLGRPLEKARALVGLADLAQGQGRFLLTMGLLSQVEELLASDDAKGASRDGPQVAREIAARAYLVHGRVMAYQGRSLEALRLTSDGLRAAPDDELELRAHLLVDLARWQSLRLRFIRALDSLDRAESIVDRSGHATAALRVHLHRGRTLGILGDGDASDDELQTAYDLASRLGDERLRSRTQLLRGELCALAGEHHKARALCAEARRAAAKVGDRLTGSLSRALLMFVGEGEDEAEIEVSGVPILDLTWQLAAAARLIRRGDRPGAANLLREAVRIERRARVHLLLRLALLRAAGREELADRLVRAVAWRLPAGSMRRRFLTFAERVRV
jgi:tetratricopeptide (TPR) repeat protein